MFSTTSAMRFSIMTSHVFTATNGKHESCQSMSYRLKKGGRCKNKVPHSFEIMAGDQSFHLRRSLCDYPQPNIPGFLVRIAPGKNGTNICKTAQSKNDPW